LEDFKILRHIASAHHAHHTRLLLRHKYRKMIPAVLIQDYITFVSFAVKQRSEGKDKTITAIVKKRIICTSDERSATKINPGLRTFAAVNVQQIFRSG